MRSHEDRIHQTYKTKPFPHFQKQAVVARFEDQTVIKPGDTLDHPVPPEIPSASDLLYDPDHPDADWTGFVPKYQHRKHASSHRSQQCSIQQTDVGLTVPGESIGGHKKRVDNVLGGQSHIVIAGIAPDDNDRWKTNYSRFANQESTTRSQLTLVKRQLPRRNIEDPAQASSITTTSYFDEETLGPQSSTVADNSKQYGSHSRTFLSNLSSSLVDILPDPKSGNPSTKYNLDKTLITQNYNPTPGTHRQLHLITP